MWRELDRWDRMDRELKLSGLRSLIGGLLWVAACILLASIIAGCQPGEKPSTVDLLVEAENVIATAAETTADAIALGRLDPASETYGRIYQGLQAASRALDAAWQAYRAGDMVGADGARRVALDAYMAIRPMLMEVTS